jgi:hypothetical protein
MWTFSTSIYEGRVLAYPYPHHPYIITGAPPPWLRIYLVLAPHPRVPRLVINYPFRLHNPATHVLVLLIQPVSAGIPLDKDIVTPGVKILSPRVPGPV